MSIAGKSQSLDSLLEGELPQAMRAHWAWPVGEQPTRKLLLKRALKLPHRSAAFQPHRLADADLNVAVQGLQIWFEAGLFLDLEAGVLLWQPCAEGEQAAWLLALAEWHRNAGVGAGSVGGWLPLHAAAAARGGRAVAVLGVSGAGKSTAALRLMNAGYDVLCEDGLWWQPETGLCTGLDQKLRVLQPTLDLFAPTLKPTGRDPDGKWTLPLSAGRLARLEQVLFLAPEPLDAVGQLRTIWEATGVPLTATGQRQAEAGVQRLLALPRRTVTRDAVLEAVAEALGATRVGNAATR